MVKRILFGFLWFVVILMVSRMIAGGVVGASAGAGTTTFEGGYQAGFAASQAFFGRWGWLFTVGSLALAVLGTWKGVLPGTKPKKIA